MGATVKLYFTALAFTLSLSACDGTSDSTRSAAPSASSCKGVYYTHSSSGQLQKWNQYWQADQGACLTDTMPLSNWQTTSAKFINNVVQCTPQAGISSQTLIAANNYYSYRDGKVLLDLNSSTGIYRKITTGYDTTGAPLFSRSEGCFYQRTGAGVDAARGPQLLLDTNVAQFASTEDVVPFEIFTYTISGINVAMTRFDSVADWDYTYCPASRVPTTYCMALDDGNSMFWPNLPAATKAALTNEAILIRTKYNWVTSSTSAFNMAWTSLDNMGNPYGTEAPTGAFVYQVVPLADTPYFLDSSWRSYLIGTRATMPDTSSQTTPVICFPGSQDVLLTNGSRGKVYGELCFQGDGTLTFTGN